MKTSQEKIEAAEELAKDIALSQSNLNAFIKKAVESGFDVSLEVEQEPRWGSDIPQVVCKLAFPILP
jgi:hypothetical protein